MPRTCTVCSHPERKAIDKAIVAGDPYRGIAQRFAASPDAVLRHKAHVLATLAKATSAAEVVHADDLIGRLLDANRVTLEILAEARAAGELDTALRAVARLEKQIELQGELLGELNRAPTVNIHTAPQWVQLQTLILTTLDPYPEAKAALAAAMQGVAHA